MKNGLFGLLVFLCFGVTVYAVVTYAFFPLGVVLHPDMRVTFEAHRVAIYTHIFASAVALALGPLQFASELRATRPSLHRLAGRLYLGVGTLLGGGAGLYMALYAFGGPYARAGFACLAIVWLYTGVRSILAIRAGDVAAHRRWNIRNFALTLAAVTLRLWLPAAMLVRVPFEVAYPVVAWLCWVPNLLVAQVLARRATPSPQTHAAVHRAV